MSLPKDFIGIQVGGTELAILGATAFMMDLWRFEHLSARSLLTSFDREAARSTNDRIGAIPDDLLGLAEKLRDALLEAQELAGRRDAPRTRASNDRGLDAVLRRRHEAVRPKSFVKYVSAKRPIFKAQMKGVVLPNGSRRWVIGSHPCRISLA